MRLTIEDAEHELERCGSTEDPVVWHRLGCDDIETTPASICMALSPFDDAKEVGVTYSSMTRDRMVCGTLSGLVSDRLKGLGKERCRCD